MLASVGFSVFVLNCNWIYGGGGGGTDCFPHTTICVEKVIASYELVIKNIQILLYY